MSRRWLQGVAAGLAAIAAVSLALGQKEMVDREARPTKLSGGLGGGWGSPWYGVPGYGALASTSVQKELGLSDAQKQKLRKIADEYRRETQEAWRQQWEKIRHLSPEEQQKYWAEERETLARRGKERIAAVRKAVEVVLTPQQLQQLQEINFRNRAAAMLQNPGTLDRLGATQQQKERLRKLHEELQQKIYQLQRQAFEESFQVLTPDQQRQLREMATREPG